METESLIRVQNFQKNRAGDEHMNFDIRKPLNRTQLKSIKDSETSGKSIGFSVGKSPNDVDGMATGQGYRDLTKTLRERKFIG